MKQKILIPIIAIFIGIIGGVFFFNYLKPWADEKHNSREIDYALKALPPENVFELLRAGKVRRISYPKDYADPFTGVRITLKEGGDFYSGPIPYILSALQKCGAPCTNVEVDAW